MVLKGVPGRGTTRFDAYLRVDGSKVGVDGSGADSDTLSKLSIRQAAADESQDLDLAPGQAVCPGAPRHDDA